MKKLLLLAIVFSSLVINAQNVYIPDASFRAYLNTYFPSYMVASSDSLDSVLAASYSGTMDCHLKNITDLTGIECFTNLTMLKCGSNPLTSINLSTNTDLEYLSCYSTKLTSIDLSNNPALSYLDLSAEALSYLSYSPNKLTSLDLTENTALSYLNFRCNLLSDINLSTNTALLRLYCEENLLTSLDLSTNLDLYFLYCCDNDLLSLDLSLNTSLAHLYCRSNLLEILDLSQNVALTNFYCTNNHLTSLDLRNGNNINMLGSDFNAYTNPDLYCIEVDDYDYSFNNWSRKDSQSYFSVDCSTLIHETENYSFSIYPNPTEGKITIQAENLEQVYVYNFAGRLIKTTNRRELNLSQEAKGIYFVKVITSEGSQTKKLVLE